MTIDTFFAPYDSIAADLLPHAMGAENDGAHDAAHLLRVWKNVQAIAKTEGGDMTILVAATLLHDCVDVPKNSALRSSASRLAAAKARDALSSLGWQPDKVDMIAHAIEAHSFSANIQPRTIEARVLQDADRLDAIGHIGVARCFYVSGGLGRALYDLEDPVGQQRDLDDLTYAIDHFQTKLLTLLGSFQTETGNTLARSRHKVVAEFLEGLLLEISLP